MAFPLYEELFRGDYLNKLKQALNHSVVSMASDYFSYFCSHPGLCCPAAEGINQKMVVILKYLNLRLSSLEANHYGIL